MRFSFRYSTDTVLAESLGYYTFLGKSRWYPDSSFICFFFCALAAYLKRQVLLGILILILMHLADAFIQSDLHCIQVTVLYLSALAFPGNRTHDLGVASAMLYHLSYRKAVQESWDVATSSSLAFFHFIDLFKHTVVVLWCSDGNTMVF